MTVPLTVIGSPDPLAATVSPLKSVALIETFVRSPSLSNVTEPEIESVPYAAAPPIVKGGDDESVSEPKGPLYSCAAREPAKVTLPDESTVLVTLLSCAVRAKDSSTAGLRLLVRWPELPVTSDVFEPDEVATVSVRPYCAAGDD